MSSLPPFTSFNESDLPLPTPKTEETMIEAIFYARFLPEEGVKVVYQNPPGSIIADAESPNSKPLLNFEAVSEFVIPRQAFCNRLVTVNDPSGKYLVIGFPVCLKNQSYNRNEFMFNFSLVLDAGMSDFDTMKYEVIVKRLAGYFTELEVQSQFLSQESGTSNSQDRRSIWALLEIIREDLNNYSECMIPVDEANTINLKLFPTHKDPPKVKSWHVPILLVKPEKLDSENWDITVKKIIPFIDGTNDVRRISQLADASLELTKIAISHLLMYSAATFVDKFFFSNTYCIQPIPFEDFINNVDGMQDECARYICPGNRIPAGVSLCQLYGKFTWGRTVRDLMHQVMDTDTNFLQTIDPRRLVQFGVIKSFLHRVQKFPISNRYISSLATRREIKMKPIEDFVSLTNAEYDEAVGFLKYTGGCHCMDQIITETNLPEGEIMKKFQTLSRIISGNQWEVQILYR